MRELKATGLPLGVLGREAAHEEAAPVPSAPGDALLLATDGVWEEVNAEGERFGKERLSEAFGGLAGRERWRRSWSRSMPR